MLMTGVVSDATVKAALSKGIDKCLHPQTFQQ